jgi:glutamine amidotransferase
MVYMGKPIIMADIVTRPQNSIVHQSRHSPYLPFVHGHHGEAKVMNTAINGDGFGVGWYDNFGPEPCVFKSTIPSWNCTNLQAIAAHVQTHCAFAHVRAASNGSISEANCHPFKFGKMLFMQNGTIAHFTKIRVEILEEIKYTTASMIEGMTDSEHAGALYVHFLPDHDPNRDHSGHVMKEAMLKMIKFILDVVKQEEEKTEKVDGVRMHTPSNMNFAVTDGTVMIATRYRDSKISHPPSLYFSEAKQLHLHDSDPENNSQGVEIDWHYPSENEEAESVVVASEPLTRQPKNWMLVPRNHLLVITAHQRTIIEAIEFEDQESEDEKVEEAPADETEVKNEIEETMASEWDLAGAATEKITGEEELREEVLRDPRNMMKVGKNRGSVEEQKKVKKELKDKAPDFGNMPTFDAGRRRHSLASWYPRMASDHPSAGVTSLSPLPPTTGHATPPLVHRANSSVGDAPRKRPHKRADRLEVMPSDLYSSPQPLHAAASSSPINLKLVETGGESDTKDAKDLQKATKSKKHDTTKPDLTEEGQEKDAMGLQKRKTVSPVEDLDVRAGSVGEPLEKLKNKGKAKLDELGKSLDVSRSDAMVATKQALSAAGDMHIRLDMSKGFLLLAIVNVLCAIMWAARC